MFWPLEFFKALVARRRGDASPPLLAGFKLTHRCNLKCIHCPFWRRESSELGYEAVVGTLHRLHAMGVRMVIFEGGEPLLWRDGTRGLADVLEAAAPLFLSVGVTTNGTLPLDLPADVIWVSLDGLEATHDRIRGPGAFERVLRNLEGANHPRLYVNLTVNRGNAGDVEPLVRFLAGRVRGVTVQFHYPYEGLEDPLLPTPSQRMRVLDTLIRLKEEGWPVADSVAALEALKGNQWRCHDHLLANVEPDGTIRRGCYVKGRGGIACRVCGFAAHTEISLAYEMNLGALLAGKRIFGW
ncbi:MAG: radical SAM protein [Planctomycetota bacterium]|jgi:MoaA/NifB/PqqE/SkfB family radical SAM enzyme